MSVLPPAVTGAVFAEAVLKNHDQGEKLDILVNNAAFQQHQVSLEELSEEQWDRTFKTNILEDEKSLRES